ncbi:exodeoxyribonuclease III [Candidatus Saccharibacteria bacterium]|nr:exodeoxyribonuclease III [Candidatus Saccharibacteria bacterium]MBR6122608.1 exodeoxyribonuclease III [Candidatus Saccharibacteria bacterium]
MRLYSWNVNGLRAVLRKGALQQFLKDQNPDVLCLQEIKCKPDQLNLFETDALKDYQIFWHPAERPGYSGTATLVRVSGETSPSRWYCAGYGRALAREARDDGPERRGQRTDCRPQANAEGRVLVLEFPDFYLVNVYTPNSKPDLSRLQLRHDSWDPEFKDLLKDLEKTKPIITCGDFNCAHAEIDLARPNQNHHNAGFTDEEREGLTNLLNAGFTDTFRSLHPTDQRYTWWSHWGQARANNIGWRIDYFFVSNSLKPHLKDAEIYETVTGSDHCPISITMEF